MKKLAEKYKKYFVFEFSKLLIYLKSKKYIEI